MSDHDAAHNLRSDTALLARLHAGEDVAFDILVHAYAGPLIRHAAAILGSADSAQEVVQETFFHLWRVREHIQADWDIAAYLYGRTRQRALHLLQAERSASHRDQRWVTQHGIETNASQEEFVDDATEIRTVIWNALADVPPRCREVFMLVWDRQLRYKEIARRLGLAEPTVRSHVSRAVKHLADVLEPRYRERLRRTHP